MKPPLLLRPIAAMLRALGRRRPAPRPPAPTKARPAPRPILEELEPRLLYAADHPLALLGVAAEPAQVQAWAPAPVAATAGSLGGIAATAASQPQRLEIVFIDGGLDGADALAAAWAGDAGEGVQRRIVVLDPRSDALRQIGAELAATGAGTVDAVHLVSHGAPGRLQLGAQVLDLGALQERADEVRAWQAALGDDADLLIYGCDLAASADGRAFAALWAELTGTDVTASQDATGSAALGGNWELEYATGALEASAGPGTDAQVGFSSLLAISAGSSSTAGSGTGVKVSSLTWSHTVGSGNDRVLIVGVSMFDSGSNIVSSVAYGGQALTRIEQDSSSKTHAEMWMLTAPVEGTADIVVSLTKAVNVVAGATAYSGVDQSTPYSTVATGNGSSDPTFTVASAAGELVVDIVADRDVNSETVGAGQTAQWVLKNGTASSDAWGGSSSEQGAASVTMSWSTVGAGAGEWAAVAVSLRPSSNTAPVLDSSKTPVLDAVAEDAGAPVGAVGTLVSTLVDFSSPAGGLDNLSDIDAGALPGIAIVGADTANGSWWFSIDDGASWAALGTPSDASARLLAADAVTRLAFQPGANLNGTLAEAITFRAWDQTSGANGAVADATVNGGTSAFSSSMDSAAITVGDANDAPVNHVEALTQHHGHEPAFSAMADQAFELKAGQSWGQSFSHDSAQPSYAVDLIGMVLYRAADATPGQTLTVSLRASWNGAVIASGAVSSDELQVGESWLSLDLSSQALLTDNQSYVIRVDSSGDGKVYLGASESNAYASGALLDKDGTSVSERDAAFALREVVDRQTVEDTPLVFSAAAGNAVWISDPDAGTEPVQVTLTATAGTVSLGSVAGLAFGSGDGSGDALMVFTGTLADINAALEGLSFLPSTDFHGTASLQIATDDLGNTGAGGARIDTDSIDIVVLPVNDAPTTNTAVLVPADEDGGARLVTQSELLAEASDVDGDVLEAIGLSIAGGNGSLVDNGDGSWNYTPTANDDTEVVFGYTISDGNGGTVQGTASLDITPVNDAPGMPGVMLGSTSEDSSKTWQVATFVSGSWDVDDGALKGLAIVGVDDSHGSWQYTLDGSTWFDIGAVAANNALLLAADATSAFRFVPDADWNGSTGMLQYKAWDQTSGTAGSYADASVSGGTTAFSGTSGSVLQVTAVNDAPTALVAGVDLAAVPEDSADPAGATVSELFAAAFGDARDEVTGGSSANAFAGIAIVGNAADAATEGSWQWHDGSGWAEIGMSLSTAGALTLSPATLVRFLPNADYHGSPGALTVRLVDDSGGAVTDGATVNVGTGGGSSRYSDAGNAVVLGTSVTAVNDAPLITSHGGGASAAIAIPENTSAVGTVTSSDIDGGAATYSIVAGGDGAKFTIDAASGVLGFLAAPDFEKPGDIDGDNVYELTVQVSDGAGGSDTQAISVTVGDVADGIRVTPTALAAIGGETRVNTTTADIQTIGPNVAQSIATDADGNFVVVWASNLQDGSAYGIYAQRHAADGSALGSEFQVNTTSADNQINPAVAMDAAGNFVVTWASNLQDGSGYGVYAQRFDAAGTAQGAEFLVNTTTAGGQSGPAIAISTSGDFVITWTGSGQDPDASSGIYAQRYDAGGVAQGGEFRVNSYTLGTQQLASAAMDAAGNFVVTWASLGQDGDNYGVYGQRFDATGAAQGAEFRVNTTTANSQLYHDVAMLADGRFAVAFQSRNADGSFEVGLQRYDVDGSAVGGEIRVNTSTVSAAQQPIPSLAVDASGNLTVVWNSAADGSGTAVVARRLDWSGTALGAEFQVNTTTAGDQLYPEAVAQPGGGLLVAWGGNGDGDASGVFLQRYGLTTTEGGGNASFSVVLEAAPTADVEIPLSVTDASEGTIAIGSLIFTAANWNIAQTVTVTGVQDFVNDGDQRYQVVVGPATSADPNFDGLDAADLVVTNLEIPNLAPVNSVPGAQSLSEDSTLVFSSANGNAISIADADAGGGLVEVLLTATQGTLTLGGSAGLVFVTGDGSDDAVLNFTGTIADINAALEGLSFAPDADYAGPASLQIVTGDLGNSGTGGASSDSDTVSITVDPVNDAPVITGSGGTLVYTENDAATAVDPGLTLSDVDSGNLSEAQVWIGSNYVDGQDVLGFSDQNGITGSWDAATGSLSLSGSATVAQYEAALRSVTYVNASDAPSTATRVVQFAVDDGATGSNTASRDVGVVAVNDAPTTSPVALAPISEDSGPRVITLAELLANASDVDGDLLVATGLTIAAGNGSLVDNGDGTWTYTPAADDDTAVSFAYTVSDGTDSVAGSATLDITPVNDAPTTSPVVLAPITEDSGARLITQAELLASASDVDGDPLVASALTVAAGNGSLVDNGDGTWTYTPAADDDTSVSFGFTIGDGQGGTVAGTATLVITPVNDAPTTSPVVLAPITEDSGARLITQAELLANAADVDGDALVVSGLTIAAGNGSLVDNGDGTWTYTPGADDDTAVSFSYTISDGAATLAGTATLDITPVNDAPTTSPVVLAPIAEDSGARLITQAELLANAADVDGDALVAASLTIAAGNGSLVDNGDGTWTYTPGADDDTAVSFSYTISDGAATVAGTATLDITPVNDAPTTGPVGLVPIAEDSGPRVITQAELLANASDVEGDALVATGLTIVAGNGSLVDNGDGTWTYTAAGDDDTSVSFGYTISDGNKSVAGSATLDLTPVNNAPTTSAVVLAPIAEDSGPRVITLAELLANASDVDGDLLVATGLTIAAGNGSLVDNGDGTWTYTAAADDDTSVSFAYTISDGAATVAGTATLDITPVNDAPTTSPVVLAPIGEDSGARLITQAELLANAADVDGDALVAAGLTIAAGNGSLVDNGDGTWTYIAAADDDTAVSFAYTISDGAGTVAGTATLDITQVNDAPTTSPVVLAPIGEDSGPRVIALAELLDNASDVDGDLLAATGLTIAAGNGSLVDNGDGTWTYTPGANDDTAVGFSYTISDGTDSVAGSATLDITPANDSPTTSPVVLAPIGEDSGARLITQAELLANAADVDGDVLVVSGLTIAAGNGSLVDNGDGTWTYTPAADDDTSVSIAYMVSDGTDSVAGSATLDITQVNDAPTTGPVVLAPIVEDGGPRVITQAELLANASDVEGDALVATGLTIVAGNGSLVDNGDGTWTYTAAADDDTSVSFAYTISDGTDGVAGSATLDITSGNDAPTTTPVALAPIAENSGPRVISQAELLANASDVDGDALVASGLTISAGSGGLVDNGDGTWTYTPAADDDASVSFAYTISDGIETVAGTATVDITPVNDAPTTTPVVLAPIAEDSGPRVITQAELLANAADIDGDALVATGLTITAGNGSLVDNGDGTWTYAAAADDETSVSFAYTISDGTDSVAGAAILDITPVNDAPTAGPVILAPIAEDSGPRVITQAELLSNAADTDGDALAATGLAITAGNGSLVDNGDGTWTYTPAADDDTSVSFAYTISDGVGGAVAGSAALDITPVDGAPTTSPVVLAPIAEDSGARIITQAELLANASDLDGDALVATGLTITAGNGGLVDNGDGTWSYTPAANDDSAVGFGYTISDGAHDIAGSAALDITQVNDAPTTSPVVLAAIAEDSGPRVITQAELLANAADVDGDALVATGLTIAAGNGSLVDHGDGTWTYTPAAGDDSVVSFAYTISDGLGGAVAGSAVLDITPVDGAPTTSLVVLAPIAEDSGPRVITQAELLANAADVDGDTLTATGLTITGGRGSLADNGDGTWTYTPAADDDITVSFGYTISDGTHGIAGSATLDIAPVNDAPTTSQVVLAPIAEDSGPRVITQVELLANAADSDGDALAATGLAITAGNGSLVDHGDGTWTYTPASGDEGEVVFGYTIRDGQGGAVAGSAALDITPVNDAPTTSPVALAPIAEDSGARLITQAGLLANAADIDGDALTATGLTITAGNGSLVDNGDGTWTYTPAPDDDTAVSYSYTITDGADNVAGSATLDITPVNDAPTTSPVVLAPVAEDSGARVITQAELLANAADIDGDALVATGLTIAAGDGSLVDNGDGTWTYTPAADDDTGASFGYTISDGTDNVTAIATLDITAVNDAPTTSPVVLAPIAEDSGPRLITQAELLANAADIDGDALVATGLTINAGNGSLVDHGDGSWSYAPAADDDTGATFGYTISDGTESVAGGATLEIIPVNDAPTTSPVVLAPIAEDSGARLVTQAELLAHASDVDGDALAVTGLTITAGSGSLVDHGDGTWTFAPAADDDTGATFGYTISDASDRVTATATLDITAVNDAPTATAVVLAPVAEDSGARRITQAELLAGAGDIDGDALTTTGLTITAGRGSLADQGDGTWTYTPAADDDTALSLGYTIDDGQGGLVAGRAQFDIAAVNDAPTGLPAISGTAMEGQALIADTASLGDVEGLGAFSYQWLRDGAAIDGATGLRYTPGLADIGARISLAVSYVDGAGTAETIVSQVTLPAAARPPAPDSPVNTAPRPTETLGQPIIPSAAMNPVDRGSTPAADTAMPPAGAQDGELASTDAALRAGGRNAQDGADAGSAGRGNDNLGDAAAPRHGQAIASDVGAARSRQGAYGPLSDAPALRALIAGLPAAWSLDALALEDFETFMQHLAARGNDVAGRSGGADDQALLDSLVDQWIRGAEDDEPGVLDFELDPVAGGGLLVSAGALLWLARAGGLLAALMTSLPAWRAFDPLPILGRPRDEERRAVVAGGPPDARGNPPHPAAAEAPAGEPAADALAVAPSDPAGAARPGAFAQVACGAGDLPRLRLESLETDA